MERENTATVLLISKLTNPLNISKYTEKLQNLWNVSFNFGRLCGLVVRVLGYRSGGPGSIPGNTRFSGKKKKEHK
jgi:hypothetical protein